MLCCCGLNPVCTVSQVVTAAELHFVQHRVGESPFAQLLLARCLLYLQALNPDKPETQQELSEVVALAQQQLARQIGLPGLAISADPGGWNQGPTPYQQHGAHMLLWATLILSQLLECMRLEVASSGAVHACVLLWEREWEREGGRAGKGGGREKE